MNKPPLWRYTSLLKHDRIILMKKKPTLEEKWSGNAIKGAWLAYFSVRFLMGDSLDKTADLIEKVKELTLFPKFKESKGKKYTDVLRQEWIKKSALVPAVRVIVHKRIQNALKKKQKLVFEVEFEKEAFGWAVMEVVDDTTPENLQDAPELGLLLSQLVSDVFLKSKKRKDS